MHCRPGCGACCIAVSISSSLPGMPDGKPAGVRCANLTVDNACMIHDTPEFPRVCAGLKPGREMCGQTREEAMAYLTDLEEKTKPH